MEKLVAYDEEQKLFWLCVTEQEVRGAELRYRKRRPWVPRWIWNRISEWDAPLSKSYLLNQLLEKEYRDWQVDVMNHTKKLSPISNRPAASVLRFG